MKRFFPLILVLTGTLFLSGCASVAGQTDPEDPFEGFNRAMYGFNETVDGLVVKPAAQGYNAIMPNPVNKGISNFFSNLDDVVVVFNDILQLKLEQAAQDSARVFFNSTIGLLGFIDVASHLQLPKHDEDFGQTLGYWGVEPGPYLVLPFFGPRDVRDTVGLVADAYVNPQYDITPDSTQRGLTVLDVVDTRAGLLSASRVLEEAALDPYLFVRDAYLQRRQNLVYDGNPPKPAFNDF